MHLVHAEHRAMMAMMGSGENCPENHQSSQRKGPKAQILSEPLETPIRAGGKKENEVSQNGQRRRRNQCQEVNHCYLLNALKRLQ
jgi:hypothetical protein